jgi:hypothetical protein
MHIRVSTSALRGKAFASSNDCIGQREVLPAGSPISVANFSRIPASAAYVRPYDTERGTKRQDRPSLVRCCNLHYPA